MPKSQEDTQNSNIMHGLKIKAKHHHINASACLLMLVLCSQSTVDADQAKENKRIWYKMGLMLRTATSESCLLLAQHHSVMGL